MAYYDPITGEYKEGEDPNAPASSPTAAIAAAAPDPKAGFVKVGSTGDQNRDNMIQAFMRGMQERSVLLNKDPSVVLDEMLDKVGPGKVMLTNMLHGAGAALLNQPFKTVRESLLDRLVEQQKIQLQQQQNDSLRLQQFLQMQSREDIVNTQEQARTERNNTSVGARLTIAERQAQIKEQELELKGEQIFSELGLDWAKFRETERHNKVIEEIGLRGVANKEALTEFKKTLPPPGGITENQKMSASLRLGQMYDKSIAPAQNAINNFNRINASVKQQAKTGVKDYNLVYSYVLALDDMSTVREGEVEFMKAAQGLKQRIETLPERLNGKFLAQDTIDDIMAQANAIAESFRAATERERSRYMRVADEFGLNKTLIADPFQDKSLTQEEEVGNILKEAGVPGF